MRPRQQLKQTGVLLAVIAVFLVVGAIVYFGVARATLTQKSIMTTSAAEFSKGTLVNTIVENVSGGEVRLQGGATNWIPGDYIYRRPVSVTENSGTALAEYQVLVTITPATFDYLKCQAGGGDIRFGDINGAVLDYYTEEWNYNGTSSFWVKVPAITASGSATIYIYYGNPAAVAASSIVSTFSYSTPKIVGYVVSQRTANTGLSVVSLAAGNQITDGTSTLNRNDQQTGSFPAAELAMGTPISARGLFQADGAGTGTDTISPISWSGTEFIYNVQRRTAASSTFYLVSPFGSSNVTIYTHVFGTGVLSTTNGPYVVTSAGTAVTLDLTTARTVRIVSNLPILVQHLFASTGIMEDSFLMYPTSSSYLYGVPSTQLSVAMTSPGDSWDYITSAGTTTQPPIPPIPVLAANASSSTTVTGNYGSAPAYRVKSGGAPIGVKQRYDANRYDSVPFLPKSEMGTVFGSANIVGYAAIAAPDPTTTARFYNGTGTLVSTQVSGVRTDVNRIGFNTGANTQYQTGGWKIVADKPVYAYYDKRIGTSYEETTLWSYKQMRQYRYPAPTVGVPGLEEEGVLASGSYESPGTTTPGSGIIDMVWNGGWGTNGSGNAFESTVTVPAGGSITFKARSSTTGGADDAAWSAWSTLGSINASGTFAATPAAFAAVPAGANRYAQVKAEFASNGTSSPVMFDYTLWYSADEEKPTNPTLITGYRDDSESDIISDDTWYNYATPHFRWSGAADPDSGVAGYYVYFGSDAGAIPSTAGVFQTAETFTGNISLVDSGRTFYLRIQAADNAGNIFTNADISTYTYFSYRYDSTKPTNPAYVRVTPAGWTVVNNFDFSWPVGADTGGIYGNSGIAGYRYMRAGGGDTWSSVMPTLGVLGLLAYQNGSNLFYVKSVDNAGNEADGQAQAEYFYNADAPSEPVNLVATPPNNSTNNFSFSWAIPLSYNDGIQGYYYSVNSLPGPTNNTFTNQLFTPVFAAATKQGQNTFYAVAIDVNDNINWANYALVYFYCDTTAPGIPLAPNISDSSNRATADWRLTVTWQTPSSPGPDFAGYNVYRAEDGGAYVKIASTSGTGYLDTGLENTINYSYQISAYDTAANEGGLSTTVSAIPTGRYTSPPVLTSGPTVVAQSTRGTVTWTTDRECDSFVQYSKIPGVFNQSQGQVDSVTSHVVNLTNLDPGSTYYFQTTWRDIDGNVGTSPMASFITEPAAQISEVIVSDIGLSTALITWMTTTPTTSFVDYGTTNSYGSIAEDTSGSLTTKHNIQLSGLSHSTAYSFRVSGRDKEGNTVTGENNVFSTIVFPIIFDLRLETTIGDEGNVITAYWRTNVPTTSGVEYYPAAGGAAIETGATKLVTDHVVSITGLMDGTDYYLFANGRDAYGSQAISDRQTFRTGVDTRPPKISNLKTRTSIQGIGNEASVQVVITWTTDEPATAQIAYAAGMAGSSYPNMSKVDSRYVTTHMAVIDGLEPSSAYHFQAVCLDKVGNEGRSKDALFLTEEAKKPVLELILAGLQRRIGWLFSMFGG